MNEIVNKISNEKGIKEVVVAGPSFGEYQAANFAFRHLEYVNHVFSMSVSIATVEQAKFDEYAIIIDRISQNVRDPVDKKILDLVENIVLN